MDPTPTKQDLRVATVQFENKSGDKAYNLSVISEFSKRAATQGVDAISFHECCITGYTFARNLTKEQLLDVAELVPEGDSSKKIIQIAKENKITVLAGLFEKDKDNKIYNTYICANEDGFVAKYSKLHPFISQYLSPGDRYVTFNLKGWKCGLSICYDNNIIENVRANTLLGAEIIFMPHVTMCTPSPRPMSGFVDPALWLNRRRDPTPLRMEFRGPKGREWLMKWLPSRAYDNAIYVIFSNPIGMDDDQLKNGCSMILDPFGEIIAECMTLDDEMVVATCTPEKLEKAGGCRYIKARRPELYAHIIGQAHNSEHKVAWLHPTK